MWLLYRVNITNLRLSPKKKASSLKSQPFKGVKVYDYFVVSATAVESLVTEAVGTTAEHESTQIESHLVVSASGASGVHDVKDTASTITAKINFFIVFYRVILFVIYIGHCRIVLLKNKGKGQSFCFCFE
jgi:hypothetical protein